MSITNAGNVGIGTLAPNAQLHISGGQWDLTNTEGDLKIGNDAMRLKFGVALGGAGAGDARIRAMGGTNRLMIGTGADDTVTITGGRVGIETLTPAATLDINGGLRASSINATGNVSVQGNLNVSGTLNAPTKVGCVTDLFIYRGSQPLERGDVVALGSNAASHHYGPDGMIPLIEVQLTEEPRDAAVCGIVHTPELGSDESHGIDIKGIGEGRVGLMVTLGAYAWCKVDAAAAPIEVGDLLTTSNTPGHAQKLKEGGRPGVVIAKALAPVERGRGIIPVLVSHQ